MKKVLFLLVVLCGVSAFAQTGTKVSLSWVPSITPSYTATDIYRTAGACPSSGLPTAPVRIGIVSAPTAGFDDTSGTPGTIYCYYGTAFRTTDGVESVGSNTAQATFPFPDLAPPTNWKAIPAK